MSVRVCSPDLRTAPQGAVFWTELVQRNIAARLLRTPYREVDCKWLRLLSTERKGRSIQLGELVGKKCRCGVLLPFVHPEGSCPRMTGYACSLPQGGPRTPGAGAPAWSCLLAPELPVSALRSQWGYVRLRLKEAPPISKHLLASRPGVRRNEDNLLVFYLSPFYF